MAWVLVGAIPLLQLPYLIDWQSGFTSDSAVPYLMARHVVHLHEYPLFYWGQRYFGAIAAYVGAALMWLTGREPTWLLDLVPLLWFLAAAALLVAVSTPSRRTVVAFALLVTPPAMFMAIDRPAFTQGTFLWLGWAALAALAPGLTRAPLRGIEFAKAAAAGAVLALSAFYSVTAFIGLAALLPLSALAIAFDVRARVPHWLTRSAARLAQLALTAAIGSLGLLVTRLAHPGGSPHLGFIAPAQLPAKLRLLAQSFLQFAPYFRAGPATTGLNSFYSGLPILDPIGANTPLATLHPVTLAFAVLIALAAALGAAHVAALAWRAWRDRQADAFPFAPLYWLAILLVTAAAFVLSDQAFEIGGARYLTAIFFPLVVLVSEAVSPWSVRLKAGLAIAWSVAVIVGVVSILRVERGLNRDIDAALAFARAQGVQGGTADYWLAYNLNARAHEALIFVPFEPRYPAYWNQVRSMRHLAMVQFVVDGKARGAPRIGLPVEATQTFGDVRVTVFRPR